MLHPALRCFEPSRPTLALEMGTDAQARPGIWAMLRGHTARRRTVRHGRGCELGPSVCCWRPVLPVTLSCSSGPGPAALAETPLGAAAGGRQENKLRVPTHREGGCSSPGKRSPGKHWEHASHHQSYCNGSWLSLSKQRALRSAVQTTGPRTRAWPEMRLVDAAGDRFCRAAITGPE